MIENIEIYTPKKSPIIPNLEISILNILGIIFPVFLPSLHNIYDIEVYIYMLHIVRIMYTLFHMRECMLSHFSHIELFATPWAVTHRTPPFMGFSRHGLPCHPSGDLLDPGIDLLHHLCCRQFLYS